MAVPVVALSPYAEAIRRACVRWWDGDYRAMATEIGRAKATVYAWIRGTRGVDHDDLELVAQHAGVRAESMLYDPDTVVVNGMTIRPGHPHYAIARIIADDLASDPTAASDAEKT